MTLKDIAQELGLSLSTVSDVLNGGDTRYSEKTRSRIHEVAKRLGYRVNLQARILAGAKSGLIGIIKTVNFHQAGLERALYAGDAIHRSGYKVLSHDILWHNDGLESAVETMLASRAEGLLFDGIGRESYHSPSFKRLIDSRLPIVMMTPSALPDIPSVISDYYQGCWDLVEHLLNLGHRDFAFIAPKASYAEFMASGVANVSGGASRSSVGLRLTAYRDRLTVEGDRCRCRIIAEAPSDEELQMESISYGPTYRAVKGLLASGDVPDVLLCANDHHVIGAVLACRESGLDVPRDIAMAGFDNVAIGAYFKPFLTSVSLNTRAVAETAVDLLLKMIREGISGGQSVKVPCELIVRESCGASALSQK